MKELWCVKLLVNGCVMKYLSTTKPALKGETPADGLVWAPLEGTPHSPTIGYLDWKAVQYADWVEASNELKMKVFGWGAI